MSKYHFVRDIGKPTTDGRCCRLDAMCAVIFAMVVISASLAIVGIIIDMIF